MIFSLTKYGMWKNQQKTLFCGLFCGSKFDSPRRCALCVPNSWLCMSSLVSIMWWNCFKWNSQTCVLHLLSWYVREAALWFLLCSAYLAAYVVREGKITHENLLNENTIILQSLFFIFLGCKIKKWQCRHITTMSSEINNTTHNKRWSEVSLAINFRCYDTANLHRDWCTLRIRVESKGKRGIVFSYFVSRSYSLSLYPLARCMGWIHLIILMTFFLQGTSSSQELNYISSFFFHYLLCLKYAWLLFIFAKKKILLTLISSK